MRLQRQTVFGDKKGNCFAACLAALLDVDVASVPNFCAEHPSNEWFAEAQRWLAPRGLLLVSFNVDPFAEVDCYHGRAVFIATGKSPRGDFKHCVLWRAGRLLFDPHPSDEGLASDPESFELVMLVDATHRFEAADRSAFVAEKREGA